jgi:hypothetical protein
MLPFEKFQSISYGVKYIFTEKDKSSLLNPRKEVGHYLLKILKNSLFKIMLYSQNVLSLTLKSAKYVKTMRHDLPLWSTIFKKCDKISIRNSV